MKKVDIFGVEYAIADYQKASEQIIEEARQRNSFSVFALPVHGVIESKRNAAFKSAVEHADLIVADGQPIKWAMNYFHDAGLKDRVYGPELLRVVLTKANRHGLNVYLYGGSTADLQQDFYSYIMNTFPNVVVCGMYREEQVDQQTLDFTEVNAANPHIVLVGLGCPNQEIWIAKQKNKVNAPMLGVGAAFSFYAGRTKMAPKWMQDCGLEWLFRLMCEPCRLWRRYLYTNSYFILLVVIKIGDSIFSGKSK